MGKRQRLAERKRTTRRKAWIVTIMRECRCKDKGGRLRGKDNGKEDTSRQKEEGNSKEMEDKDSS